MLALQLPATVAWAAINVKVPCVVTQFLLVRVIPGPTALNIEYADALPVVLMSASKLFFSMCFARVSTCHGENSDLTRRYCHQIRSDLGT